MILSKLTAYCKSFLNTSLAAPGALTHRLQRRTACNAAPPASGPQNGRGGLERCLHLDFGLNKFFDPSTPSMRKGRDGGKKREKKKKRRMKIVAITSLPESTARTPTAKTPHARAKNKLWLKFCQAHAQCSVRFRIKKVKFNRVKPH